ncbi:5'-methylthioadenosine/S-adenosylhomocysteine nucleosidase [Aliivibrio salmonicida]|uniref:5'-methylthioadenosine/S-adenosylhomocysteine nucleosidase n=1 Tax=Aliivibrio salmonicida TaxID=40269 RepID=UPI003D0D524B
MRFIKGFLVTLLTLPLSLSAVAAMKSVTVEGNSYAAPQPIIIQGPMPIEAQHFAALLDDVTIEKTGIFVFYKGTLNGYPVIVSQTGKGLENTAAATAIAIERYKPMAIINQGTSGGHDKNLNVADIVLGKRTVNIGNLKTRKAKEGEGSNSLTWIPMDIMASAGTAGGDDANKIRYYEGSSELIASAHKVKYTEGKVVEGTIGSANFWNSELDRINWFHDNFGTSTEEMESSSAAQISEAYHVPFLAIRILSNNITNGGHYNPNTAKYCQSYVKEVVVQYISDINK